CPLSSRAGMTTEIRTTAPRLRCAGDESCAEVCALRLGDDRAADAPARDPGLDDGEGVARDALHDSLDEADSLCPAEKRSRGGLRAEAAELEDEPLQRRRRAALRRRRRRPGGRQD